MGEGTLAAICLSATVGRGAQEEAAAERERLRSRIGQSKAMYKYLSVLAIFSPTVHDLNSCKFSAVCRRSGHFQ